MMSYIKNVVISLLIIIKTLLLKLKVMCAVRNIGIHNIFRKLRNIIFGLWWISIVNFIDAQEPVVVLQQGRIVGIKVYTKSTLTPIEIYFGIPYARKPVGKYRFAAPEQHPGWARTLFAHRLPPRCPEHEVGQNTLTDEDCLYLNIWTPRQSNSNNYPVVVILYNESWNKGGVTTLPCEDLAADGVVVVTVSYRLGILGFFTLRNMEARGNLALLDQYLALLWVRENIIKFGGDPKKITLFGYSAGGDSVLHHIVSNRTYGLYQRAIIMAPRYVLRSIYKQSNTVPKEMELISRLLAKSLGCLAVSDKILMNCIRSKSVADILSSYASSNWSASLQPIVESYLPESEQYLPTPLPTALSANTTTRYISQLDLLLGASNLEAINTDNLNYVELSNKGWKYILQYAENNSIPESLRKFSADKSNPVLSEIIRWQFWGKSVHSKNTEAGQLAAEGLARLHTSVRWGSDIIQLASRLSKHLSRLFVFRYSQPGVDMLGKQFNFTGAVHGADIVALLGGAMILQNTRRTPTLDEQRWSATFRRYVTNFIRFGTPGAEHEWPRYRPDEPHVHNIRSDMKDSCHGRKHDSWNDETFWTEYLPLVEHMLTSTEHNTEQLTLEKGENRLRGGLFALCGVAVVLLLLLCASVVMLRGDFMRIRLKNISTN